MARKIALSQGQITIVDDKSYDWLMEWKWYAYWNKHTKSFYAVRNSKGNGSRYQISMARQILGLVYGDKHQADHINHNTLDNQELNLRAVTAQQNLYNQKNLKGYRKRKNHPKYEARIIVNGKYMYLGDFLTAEDAHNAYLIAKEKHHTFC